jgi:hypothetical protein
MPTYLLGILVHDLQLYESMNDVQSPIWLTLRADGLNQPFTTCQQRPAACCVWNCPVRLVLSLPTLDGSHFKTTLRTWGYLGEDVPLACSQIQLNTLMMGQPKRFSFPLMLVQNYQIPAAMVTVTVGLSMLPAPNRPQPYTGYQPPLRPPPAREAPYTGYPGAPFKRF